MKKLIAFLCMMLFVLWTATTATATPTSPQEYDIVEKAKSYFIGDDRSLIEAYVNHNYRQFLDRSPEPEGLNYYSDNLFTGEMKTDEGARGFGHSPEFIDKNVSDEQFVDIMYNAFLMRPAEQEGYDYYTNNLNSGSTRKEIMEGFINSEEYAGLILNNRFLYYEGSSGSGASNHPYSQSGNLGYIGSPTEENSNSMLLQELFSNEGGNGYPGGSDISGWAPGNQLSHQPEPGTMILLGSGLLGLAVIRRRFKK